MLIILFWTIVLADNVTKFRTTICQLGAITSGMSQEAFFQNRTGEGETYRERLRIFVLCPEYGVEMTDISLIDQCQCLCGANPAIKWYRLPVIQHESIP